MQENRDPGRPDTDAAHTGAAPAQRPTLQMRKLSVREDEGLDQGRRARNGQR